MEEKHILWRRERFYHTWEKTGSTHYYEVDFLLFDIFIDCE